MPAVKRPVVGVATLLIRETEGTILLAERRAGKQQGWMNCPGGHLEWGETFEDCAHRETYEETGIELVSCEFLTAANGLALDEDHHYVMIYMLATDWKGEAKQMEEANGPWEWHPIPGPKDKMLPTTMLAICAYFERRMNKRG